MAVIKPLLLSTVLVLSLSACESFAWREFNTGDPSPSNAEKTQILEEARKVAEEKKKSAMRSGQVEAAEKVYRAAPKDPYSALAYANVLRQVGMLDEAEAILNPFVLDPVFSSEDVLVGYAKIRLAQGDFAGAQSIIEKGHLVTESPETLMVTGIALDAQGKHEQAEEQFRKALDRVEKDVDLENKIWNNLAVSLIAQGRRNEAALVLSQIRDSVGAGDSTIEANRKLIQEL